MLFIAMFLFLFFGYQISFSDSFKLVGEISRKKEKLRWLKEKEQELPVLKRKMQEFDKAFSKNDSSTVRDKLTAYISDFAEDHNCIVTEIPVSSSFKRENLNVQTNTFTVKGNFHNLLSLLYKLENEHKYLSKIVSARYFTTRDPQTKRKNLYLTMIMQSFEQKNR
jgi:hypothetical protein